MLALAQKSCAFIKLHVNNSIINLRVSVNPLIRGSILHECLATHTSILLRYNAEHLNRKRYGVEISNVLNHQLDPR